jgi:hypothetical protein
VVVVVVLVVVLVVVVVVDVLVVVVDATVVEDIDVVDGSSASSTRLVPHATATKPATTMTVSRRARIDTR